MAAAIDPEWAWAEYEPGGPNPWDRRKVGHLYRRAAFGADRARLDAGLRDGPRSAVTALLSGGDGLADFEARMAPLADSAAGANNIAQARAWWLYRMLGSPHPLREKLTLFWHGHFATSQAKVLDTRSMLGQYGLMYRHALGRFDELLLAMTSDPAMLVWLDTAGSTRRMPNENYARELMELFSLGIGKYTEADVREAARAFTGWELRDGKARFNPRQFDDGEKAVFGRRGRFGADDVVRLCLDHPACPRFIARELFVFLVSETLEPTDELLAPLAGRFRESGHDTGALVETILRSNLFFSPEAYRSRVKSPVEFALGIVNALEGRVGTTGLADAMEPLGQILFEPPSVKGWDGGPAWLNAQTLLARNDLALALTSTEDLRFGSRCDPARLAARHGIQADEALVDFFLDLFLQGDVPADARSRLLAYVAEAKDGPYPVYWSAEDRAAHRVRAVCHLALCLPEFQLD